MKSLTVEKLKDFGYWGDKTNVTFSNNIFGSATKEGSGQKVYKAIAISIEENGIDSNDLNSCILSKSILEEIVSSTEILYTDFGLDVHSHTLKSKPFNTLKIVKTRFNEELTLF